ncbi:bifunctional tetrahydrofolate synthase/dihydrofolate synthase, partial [Acinetobacter baumannii]
IAVITNIGLDHTDWLGDTIEKIAFEKAGIIRPHIPVIFAGEQSLPQAIQDKANSSQATLYAINRDYFYKLADDGKHWYFASEGTTLRLPLGTLAIENIAGAVAAVLNSGLEISQLALEEGITNARLAGRFEVREVNGKTIIFDAGHNPHGVEFLLKQLRNFLEYNKQYT